MNVKRKAQVHARAGNKCKSGDAFTDAVSATRKCLCSIIAAAAAGDLFLPARLEDEIRIALKKMKRRCGKG